MRIDVVAGSLAREVHRDVALPALVSGLQGRWTGWLQGVGSFELIAIEDGFLQTGSGRADTDDVYDAVIFDGNEEIRWRRRGVLGTVARVREGGGEVCFQAVIDGDAGLLWGQGEGQSGPLPGWSLMSTARLGSYAAPVADVTAGGRVGLRHREYLARSEHGAAVIVERRLIGFRLVERGDQ